MKRNWVAIGLAIFAAAIIGCSSTVVRERERPEPGSEPTLEATPGNQQPASSINDSDDRSKDFSLLSTNGGVVSFGDLRGTLPVAVFFYGGAGCDGCEDRLRLMQQHYSRFKQIGAELIAVSTDLPDKTRSIVDAIGAEFPVLSDVDGSVSEDWGVFNVLSNGHAAPAIFIFSPSGDEIARQISNSAVELPGIDEMLQTIRLSLDSGTAQPTATPQPAKSGAPGIADTTLVSLGAGVTDFRLPDAIGGGEVSLGETLRDKNVVLVFYRAFW